MINFINRFQREFTPSNPNGRASAANSAPSVMSTEDKAVLDAQAASLTNLESNSSDSNVLLSGVVTSTDAVASNVGFQNDTVAAADTSNVSLNALFKRLLQRVTTLLSLFPSSLGAKTKVTSLAVTLASDETLPLPSGAATSAKQDTEATLIGAVTETAPASDTASSGLNGRLQRIAQNLSTLKTDFTAGTYKMVMRAAAKGATTAADVTSTNASADRQPLDVTLRDTSGNPVAVGGGTQYEENNTTDPATGTAALQRYNATDPTLTDGQMHMALLTAKGEQRTKQKGESVVTGTLTAVNTYVEVDVDGCSTATMQITTAGTQTIGWQVSLDGTTFVTCGGNLMYNIANGLGSTGASGGLGMYRVNCVGMKKVRFYCSAYTSNVTIKCSAGYGTHDAFMANSSIAVTFPGANSGFQQIEDGASGSGAAGAFVLGIRRDTAPSAASLNTSADGDYSEISVSKYGGVYVKSEEKRKATFSLTATFNPAASATDIFMMTPNAGAKGINISKVTLSASQTSGSNVDVLMLRRSTQDTAGTAVDIVAHESADTATAKVYQYTSNPASLGTAVAGYYRQVAMYAPTSGQEQKIYEFYFGQEGKPLMLRSGTNESFCINLGSATYTGMRIIITVEFSEE